MSLSHPNSILIVSDKSTNKIFGWSKSSEKTSLDCTSIQLVLIFRKLSDIYFAVQTVLSARFSKGFRFKSLSPNKLLVVITVYEFQIVETYVCQSFQTLYEASPIINVTHRSFAVFHPIMYVTHGSFAAPALAIRDFFWLYHTYSLLRGGFYNTSSGFGPKVKTLRGNNKEIVLGMPNCVGRRVICQSCITNESLNNICIRVFNVYTKEDSKSWIRYCSVKE